MTMLPQASESTHGPVHSMMYSRHCRPAGRFVQVMDMVDRSILVVEQSDRVELMLAAVAGAAVTSPNVHSSERAQR